MHSWLVIDSRIFALPSSNIFIAIVPVKSTVMQIKKVQSDDCFNMKSKSWKFCITSFYDSWVKHFRSFMFWNKMFWKESDHEKYVFILVLYPFRYFSSLKSEKGTNTKLSRAGFLYKRKR